MKSKKIIFIGGIHGAGKGTVCKYVREQVSIKSISASTLLKWTEVSQDPKNKAVQDIPDTQERFLEGVNKLEPGNYLIDGHFALFDSEFNVTKIPSSVFKALNPLHIGVVKTDAKTIARRLMKRDNKVYDYQLLEKMQQAEIENAEIVAREIGVNLDVIIDNKPDSFIANINRIIKT